MQQLEHIQKKFFEALLLPLRGASRRVTELSPTDEGHSQTFFDIAHDIVKPGEHLSAAERLELYHRQYWYRILDSLAEDFPILRKMCGDELFWDLIEKYLLGFPSRSFTLRHLGNQFAEFLRKSDLLTELQQTWFHGIALMEYAYMESFEGLQSAIPEPNDLLESIIELQQHVCLIHLSVAADLCNNWENFTPALTMPPEEIWIAVWRQSNGQSRQERIENKEASMLAQLQKGVNLGEFFESLPEPQPSPEEITSWFFRWQSNGWLGVKGVQGVDQLDKDATWEGLDRMGSQAFPMN